MKQIVLGAVSAVLALGAAGAASAHHSTAMYDMTRSIEVRGVVKDFEPQNPHMELILMVTDAHGVHPLTLEGQGVANMYRMGYRRGMINVGDTITVDYAPLRSGVEGGFFRSVILADGKSLGLHGPTGAG